MRLLGEIKWCETHGVSERECAAKRLQAAVWGQGGWQKAAGEGECVLIDGVAFALPEVEDADPEYMKAVAELAHGVREPAAWTRGRR